MTSSHSQEIERSLRASVRELRAPMVLAVSGGLDSMVLLDAMARSAPERVAAVAVFDHGSGPSASRAAAFVCAEAAARGLPAVVGHAGRLASREAVWREARWDFLRTVARSTGAVVVTGHTQDDQVETVLLRALRGAGARGLAGLYAAAAGVSRPLLGTPRAAVAAYAAERGVRSITDPTNASRLFMRNRVRHDLLPALLRVRPGLDAELLALARRAAELRRAVDGVAATMGRVAHHRDGSRSRSVAVADLTGYDAESLAVLWPALAARAGLALDRRGTRRLAAFTTSRGRAGASMQLAGGWEVVRERGWLSLRRTRRAGPPDAAELPARGDLRWGPWSFVREQRTALGGGPWRAVLPADRRLVVRAWQPGDRMAGAGGRARRVKRFFRDAGIVGPDRLGWPVVLAGEEIVWIPGVGRGTAVTGAPRRPGVSYSCELNDR